MKATFKVTFILQKGKVKSDGKAPIVTRITVNGEMAHFSTQKSVDPTRWDTKANRTYGLTQDDKTINACLDEIKSSIFRHYYDMQARGEIISALKLKNKLCSTEEKPIKSTMDLFDKFITEYAELVKARGYGKEFPSTPSISACSISSTFGIARPIRLATTPPSTSCISSQQYTRWPGTTAG